ncbi:hypothetical protein BMS3Bbin14_01119 [bacterium BMS3Bbin14]|nr:hypothetical protein BMS3Abin13_00864 [bacterium BMS3Abin13]GBE52644.1 hypothetical protein BMS3Bbin14_01119 [bacterium BMS3Bbin14]HDK43830.1 hypothetical protein [Desulfobacteraceae bacterium]
MNEEFASFEEALKTCITAENGGETQMAAILYCLENAPPELQDMFRQRARELQGAAAADHECDCGHHH